MLSEINNPSDLTQWIPNEVRTRVFTEVLRRQEIFYLGTVASVLLNRIKQAISSLWNPSTAGSFMGLSYEDWPPPPRFEQPQYRNLREANEERLVSLKSLLQETHGVLGLSVHGSFQFRAALPGSDIDGVIVFDSTAVAKELLEQKIDEWCAKYQVTDSLALSDINNIHPQEFSKIWLVFHAGENRFGFDLVRRKLMELLKQQSDSYILELIANSDYYLTELSEDFLRKTLSVYEQRLRDQADAWQE